MASELIVLGTSGKKQKEIQKENLQRDLSAFLAAADKPLLERFRLVEEAYKVNPCGWEDNSLLNNCLTLLVFPEERELLAIYLSGKKLDFPFLKRTWTESLLHSNALVALYCFDDDRPGKLVEIINEYSKKDESMISKPGLLGEVFFRLGTEMKRHLSESKSSSLEKQLAPLEGKTVKYLSPEREVALQFPKLIPNSHSSRENNLEFLLNFFIAAYDLYDPQVNQSRADKRGNWKLEYFPGNVYLKLGKLMQFQEDLLFLTEFAPKLKVTRNLLTEKLSLSDWENLPRECFSKAQDFFREKAQEIKNENDKKNQEREKEGEECKPPGSDYVHFMVQYTEASFYLLKYAPEKVNWSSLEEIFSKWFPPSKQPVQAYSFYISLQLELAKRNNTSVNNRTHYLEQIILSSEKAKFKKEEERKQIILSSESAKCKKEEESLVTIYQSLIEAKECASKWGIDKILFQSKNPDKNGKYEDLKPKLDEVNQDVLLDQIGPKEGRILKHGVVYIPVDGLGVLIQSLVQKVGHSQKMKEEYFIQQEIYRTLQRGSTSRSYQKVLFVRPLRLQTTSNTSQLSYFMERSGKSLSKRIRLQHWEQEYLSSLLRQNHLSVEEKERITSKKEKVTQQVFDEISSALNGLAQFQGILSSYLGNVISGRVEISVPNEPKDSENMNYIIGSFDYLENLIERAFVKSDSLESGRRVNGLAKIIRDKSKDDFKKLSKRDYFSSRIPYSSAVYDFLVEYHSFMEQRLALFPIPEAKIIYNPNGKGGVRCFPLTSSLEVILHGDAHLNNILDDGIIIDNKPLKRGHPFTDLAHLLEHPDLDLFVKPEEKRELINKYLDKLSSAYGEKINSQDLFNRDYLPHVVHTSLCLLGAMLNQDDIKKAQYYLRKARDAMWELNENNLLQAFDKMIMETGRDTLRSKVVNHHTTTYVKRIYPGIKIGVDFDGVIADSTELKMEYARAHYSIELKPEQCTKSKSKTARLTEAQYKEMTKAIYSTELCLRMKAVPGAKETLQNLLKSDHGIYIVTSRGGEEIKRAMEWLAQNKISYTELVGVNELPKTEACREKGLEIFIDDSYSKLVPLSGQGMELYLFSTAQNNEDNIELKDARRLDGWDGIYTIVNNRLEAKNA